MVPDASAARTRPRSRRRRPSRSRYVASRDARNIHAGWADQRTQMAANILRRRTGVAAVHARCAVHVARVQGEGVGVEGEYTRKHKLPRGAKWVREENYLYQDEGRRDVFVVRRDHAYHADKRPVINDTTGKQVKRCTQGWF